ncbi:aldoketomutase [Deinococcus piscis]|uniref:Bleomycin resistance protein n=1 Tax=Deinococcus piscis TaxID=394230 RepID=A0ABQ3K868_9DEIO|nr:VOC family protein [Deinococcus piscis]GHG06314.1 aldoketomutase [Deinococcus piscis]
MNSSGPGNLPDLVPELAVMDLQASRHFWVDLLGFQLKYERPEERFAYIVLGSAHVMLDQIGQTRTWETGPLTAPFGRGINFEITVQDVQVILDRLSGANWPLFMELEEKWYRVGDQETGVRQFLVQDPDGYLVRLSQSLGLRLRETVKGEEAG